MIKDITSSQNPIYKYIKSLQSKKKRGQSRQYTVEGIKSVQDALKAGAPVDFIAVSDKHEPAADFERVYRMPEDIFAKLCDTDTPQGVLAVINMAEAEQTAADDLVLYCDRVTDPGNMGTIIRICDAVDCTLAVSEGSVDIYSPKTVRASMGSFFHTKILTGKGYEWLLERKNEGYKIFSGALGENTADYLAADYRGKRVIVVGNEANGVSEEILKISDLCVKIPIWGRAESLNVGVAAALLLYEAKKNHADYSKN